MKLFSFIIIFSFFALAYTLTIEQLPKTNIQFSDNKNYNLIKKINSSKLKSFIFLDFLSQRKYFTVKKVK